nr:endolytic transglycosylase MltG [Rickettsiaceae bacterium]
MINLRKFFVPMAALLAITATFLSLILLYLTLSGPLDSTKNVIIYKGTSTRAISQVLKEENIIRYPSLFSILAKCYGLRGKYLKSGEYAFTARMTPLQVIDTLVSGKSVIHKFTIVPGNTIYEVIERLKEDPLLVGEIEEGFTEGFLMPSTYFYCFGDSRQKLISQMKQLMSETLDELMPKLEKGSPLKTRLEVLTLASIVEKEAMLDAEKPIIAGVFINRLKKRMKLQADPTTIYAITMGKTKLERKISKSDLATASPYNTYHIF